MKTRRAPRRSTKGALSTVDVAVQYLDNVGRVLRAKNRKYGDSVSNPERIFSRSDRVEQVRVRIDDKLSRIRMRGPHAVDEDTLLDLIGYLALLAALERHT